MNTQKLNKNNKCVKIYVRLIKEMNNYNKNFISIMRHETLMMNYTTNMGTLKINKDSILYNLHIPTLLMTNEVTLITYRKIYMDYMKIITKYITKYITQYLIIKYNIKENENIITQNILKLFNEHKFHYSYSNPYVEYIITITEVMKKYINNKNICNINTIQNILNKIYI